MQNTQSQASECANYNFIIPCVTSGFFYILQHIMIPIWIKLINFAFRLKNYFMTDNINRTKVVLCEKNIIASLLEVDVRRLMYPTEDLSMARESHCLWSKK